MNSYQASTSARKLRGSYYTDDELVSIILRNVGLSPGDSIVDPSCGDGAFLVGAVRHLSSLLPKSEASARTISTSIHGLDLDAEAAVTARVRVQEAISLHFGRDIATSACHDLELRIQSRDAFKVPNRGALQALFPNLGYRLVVVGNPPYVEAKRLDIKMKRHLLELLPGAVSGAPDLYLYFLQQCLDWLQANDQLAFVLPNKVLVNANAKAIRVRLLQEGQLRRVTFATHAKIFPGASVYPIVLEASRRDGNEGPKNAPIQLSWLHRSVSTATEGAALNFSSLPALDSGLFLATQAHAIFPSPPDEIAAKALECLVTRLPEGRLDEVLDIRWSISFHRAGLREQYITRERPNLLFARKVLGGGAYAGNGEVGRYTLAWDGWWMNYDEGRLRAEGNHIPPAAMFEAPKVVICQNGRTLRAAYDPNGHALKDTFLCGLLREVDHPLVRHPRALVGLLCSRGIHFFYSHVFHGSHVNGGYLHFLRTFLVDVPLGTWNDAEAEQVAEWVRQREQMAEAEAALELEEQVETLVAKALGLSSEEQEVIREWAETDPNWIARERIRRPRAAS